MGAWEGKEIKGKKKRKGRINCFLSEEKNKSKMGRRGRNGKDKEKAEDTPSIADEDGTEEKSQENKEDSETACSPSTSTT